MLATEGYLRSTANRCIMQTSHLHDERPIMKHGSLWIAALPLVFCLPAAVTAEMRFQHHFGDRNLSGSTWGQTALADLDGDGDLDFITGQSGGDIIWYEYHAADRWTRHLLGRDSPSEVGGAVLDVNRDGRLDFVTGGAWYENPPDPRTTTFNDTSSTPSSPRYTTSELTISTATDCPTW